MGFILISPYCKNTFSWDSSKSFRCAITWWLVSKQYGMVHPPRAVGVFHELSGGFQQPVDMAAGTNFPSIWGVIEKTQMILVEKEKLILFPCQTSYG